MIEHLRGTIYHKDGDHVVVDAAGVGYGVDVPSRTALGLGPAGSEAELWIWTHVTETDLKLYGFSTRGEREVFEVFMRISGVGPRLGLALLSTFSIEQLVQIVMVGDAEALKSVPGVGQKKAEKLLLELKGRVARLSAGIEPERLAAMETAPGEAGADPALKSDSARDAVAALEALDISQAVSRRAVSLAVESLGPDAAVEALVREGLRHRHKV